MDVNNLKCPECKKIFQSEINLQRHLDKKNCQKVFICTHCEKKFKTRLTLDRHVEKGICKNVKKKDTHFECKDCKKNLRKKRKSFVPRATAIVCKSLITFFFFNFCEENTIILYFLLV